MELTTAAVGGPASNAAERMASALLEAERRLQAGHRLGDIVAGLGVSRSTYYRWRRRFEGMSSGGVARLRDLERENTRLRRVVADQALAIEALRELSRGTY